MNSRRFIYIVLLILLVGLCLPENIPVKFNVNKSKVNFTINPLSINTTILGVQIKKEFKTKLGLDLKGGSHLVFKVDTKGLKPEDMKDFKDIEMAERFEDWQFLKLAKKYARHYHYDKPFDPDCMVCEAKQ